MRIPDNALDEFIEIYKKEFGEDISRADAGQMASDLLRLYDLLSKKSPARKTMPHDDDHPRIGFRT